MVGIGLSRFGVTAKRFDLASALLVGAAGLVGLAIAADGMFARTLNGLGGIAWLGAALLLARSVRRDGARAVAAVAVVVATVVLAVLVRPSDIGQAAIGFLVGGAVVGATARGREVPWALLVPALWLPVHLLIAVGRAVVDAGPTVRTEPPPTAALVPLVMVVAAAFGGAVIEYVRGRTRVTSIQAN